MGKLDGKNCASSRAATAALGLATAKQFVSEGATYLHHGTAQSGIQAVGNVQTKCLRRARRRRQISRDLDRLFARIKSDKGKLDIVFANAGVARYLVVGRDNPELYNSIFNINVRGLLFTVQKALPLIPGRRGSIILNAFDRRQ